MASANYLPYISDSEVDTFGSDTSSVGSWTSSDADSFTSSPGPIQKDPIKILPDKKPAFQASQNTSLVMITSRDRDTRIYPQPTFFTIRLPRVYRNIKSINVTQINLLNSFFNFAETRGNTFMFVRELGRTVRDSSGNLIPNDIKVQIRNGTYSAAALVTELNNAMNQTPLFADISGGLGSFINAFQGTGDYTLLFNQPGPVVYNSLTREYEQNVAMQTLVARYFQNVQTVGTVNFSYNECLVAYYYPVIKEMTARNLPFNLHPEALPAGFTVPSDYILFAFQGLGDPYILTLIQDSANLVLFDEFRAANTFVSFLANQYTCAYNSNQGRLTITAPALNNSIQTDLNLKYAQYLNEEVLAAGFSNVPTFNAQYAALSNQNGALLEFYNFLHTRFTNSFGINFGTYTAEFFANSNNEIILYNIIDKRGWSPTLLPDVSSNALSESVTVPSQISTPLTGINVRLTDTGAENFLSTYNLGSLVFSNASETTYGYYDVPFRVLPTCYQRLTFTSRCRQTISAMTIPRYLDARGTGTEELYPFGSNVGQTPLLFEGQAATPPYSTITIRTDISGASDFNLYNMTQVNLTSRSYFRALNRWLTYITPQILSGVRIQEYDAAFGVNPPINDIALVSYRPHIFFQMTTDGYLADPNAKFKVDIVVETQDGSVFPVPITVARYRDRAAFMIDAAQDLARNYTENPRHVFEVQTFSNTASATLTIDALNTQTNYISIHIAAGAGVLPGSIPLRVFALLHDPYGVYGQATALDFRQMPYANLPPIADQYTPDSSVFANPLKSIYDPAVTQIGYDISGVSNNLLDYYIQSSDATLFDPLNVGAFQSASADGLRYVFQYATPGSGQPAPTASNWSLYFDSNSANQIRDLAATGSNNTYLNSSIALKAPVDGNETLLVNWFRAGADPTIREEYAPPVPTGTDSVQTRISLSTPGIFLGCANPTALPTDVSTSVGYQDTTGLSGLSFFLNPNDIVRLNNIQLKMAYIQPSFDSIGTPYTRSNSPLGLTDTTNASFRNQATYTDTGSNVGATWDDWYLYNRQNVRIGIFNTDDISGADIAGLQLASTVMTMTLSKVTQVANYTNTSGTFRTREPEWGTYYSYEPISTSKTLWTPVGGAWTSTVVGADQLPIFSAGESNYPGYFLTHTNINNYSFKPRGYGIAPSVGHAMMTPYAYTSSYTTDIPNSYTIVPFSWTGSEWRAGAFWGVSYTREPAQAPPTVAGGAAPYFGPAGPFGWTLSTGATSTLVLATGAETTLKPYYWNAKVAFEILDRDYDPATDLTAFGGYTGISSEYQDTYMFLYENPVVDSDIADISGTDVYSIPYWRWGQESNTLYRRWDDQSGYNFLSYINDITVRSTQASTYDYALHVRGYVPTSEFTSGVRLIGKNYTDFGKATLSEIAGEIADLSTYTVFSDLSGYNYLKNSAAYSTIINTNDEARLSGSGGNVYSHYYADALKAFDATFYYSTITFGKKIGYAGTSFSLAGYGDALTKYVGFYSTLRGTQVGYTDVLSSATGRLNAYVKDRYANVLPTNILSRTRITDPLPFSLLFSTMTAEPYKSFYDEWGLGWNLGFKKEDTTYLTTLVSNTFIKIFDDYIYLRLNPEMNMNSMGVSAKEDLALSRETFAEDKKYFAKILLNNFGGFCRAAVQMPKDFAPTLGKYETLSMQLVDRNGVQLVNDDCEYDIVLQINEVVDGTVGTYTTPLGY